MPEALRVARQVVEVLNYLHTQPTQVIFRDLKPSNVMCMAEGQIKLIDFGIARFFKPGKAQDTALLGTPGYAAPEQYGGMGQSDARTDIYSFGVLLNRMVTGFDPTTAVSPFPIPDPRETMPWIPEQVAHVIMRATQMRPEERYGSIAEMAADLATPSHPLPLGTHTEAMPSHSGGMPLRSSGMPTGSKMPSSAPPGGGLPQNVRVQPTPRRSAGIWIGLGIAGVIVVLLWRPLALRPLPGSHPVSCARAVH